MLICEECEENIEYKDIYFCSRDCLDNYIEQDIINRYMYADGSIE